MKKGIVYSVQAVRVTEDIFSNSYTVGVYYKKKRADDIAKAHEAYRGGKVKCEVIEWVVDAIPAEDAGLEQFKKLIKSHS
jgi:hypothetical protein